MCEHSNFAPKLLSHTIDGHLHQVLEGQYDSESKIATNLIFHSLSGKSRESTHRTLRNYTDSFL